MNAKVVEKVSLCVAEATFNLMKKAGVCEASGVEGDIGEVQSAGRIRSRRVRQ